MLRLTVEKFLIFRETDIFWTVLNFAFPGVVRLLRTYLRKTTIFHGKQDYDDVSAYVFFISFSVESVSMFVERVCSGCMSSFCGTHFLQVVC